MAEFAQRRGNPSQSPTRWLIVILLAAIACCLLIEVGFSTSAARAQDREMPRRQVFAIAGEVAPDLRGIYLVDLEHGTICVYHYVQATRRLRLLAARTFVYDVQLDDYNNESLLPSEVKKLVEQQRRLESSSSRPAESP